MSLSELPLSIKRLFIHTEPQKQSCSELLHLCHTKECIKVDLQTVISCTGRFTGMDEYLVWVYIADVTVLEREISGRITVWVQSILLSTLLIMIDQCF